MIDRDLKLDIDIGVDHDIFNFIVRDKYDFLMLLVKFLEYLIYSCSGTDRATINFHKYVNESGFLCVNGKMRRVFLISPTKYVSFHFPFDADKNYLEKGFVFYRIEDEFVRIDYSVLSYLREILLLIQKDNSLENAFEIVWDAGEKLAFDFDKLLVSLMIMEDGYVRYDHDMKNINGDIHPEYHLDIFYSKQATFKVGLKQKIMPKELYDFLDLKSECSYLV